MGSSPGPDWAQWLTQTRPDGFHDDQEQPGAPKEGQSTATACLADHPAATFVLSQQIDLDLGLAALLSGLVAAFGHTRLLMTRPMQVRYGTNRTSGSTRSGLPSASTG